MWLCVAGLVIADVSKERSASIFKGKGIRVR